MPLYAPGGGGGGSHASSHENAGGDEIDVTGLTGAGGAGAGFTDVLVVSLDAADQVFTIGNEHVEFDEIERDDASMWNAGTFEATIPAGKGGGWLASLSVAAANNITTIFGAYLWVNGSDIPLAVSNYAEVGGLTTTITASASKLIALADGDVIHVTPAGWDGTMRFSGDKSLTFLCLARFGA